MDDLGLMIEEGFAQEIKDTLTALSEIEGGLENALNFDSLEACQAGGGTNCEATAAVVSGFDLTIGSPPPEGASIQS